MVYLGLFVLALLAATLLPMQSEAALVALLLTDSYSVTGLLLAAIAGNTLGSCINWWLGRSLHRFQARRWFPVSALQLQRAERWYHRYGRWTLLLSWLPIVGDPLTLVAGVMREPLPSFLLLVLLAKSTRYLLLALIVLS
jgi:membrane protein YqaA with SNARE-associated domain